MTNEITLPSTSAACADGPAIESRASSERLFRIEGMLQELLGKTTVKAHYSVDEFSLRVDREPFTVRQWCNEGRINAEKSLTQSGSSTRWVISHREYERYSKEGLLPIQRKK